MLYLAACSLHHLLHIRSNFWNATHHLPSQDVSELPERLAPPLQLLVVAHHQLNELAGVDVRVARLLNVLYDIEWQMGGQTAGCL